MYRVCGPNCMRCLFVLLYCIGMWLTQLSADSRIIFVYGSSCSGKSTLSTALARELSSLWRVIDRDDVIDQCQDEERADDFLLEAIQAAFEQGVSVIVDTQVPPQFAQNMQLYEPLFVFVYANLPTLIRRDEHRSDIKNRPLMRNYYARSWVYDTFALLLTTTPGNAPFVDTINPQDIPEDILDFSLSDHSKVILHSLLHGKQPLAVYANYPCDGLIKSHQYTLEESVNAVVKMIDKSVSKHT